VYGQSSAFLLYTGLAYLLIAITFIDIDYFIIPNGFIVIGLIVLLPTQALGWLPMHWGDGVNGSLCFAGFLFAMGVIGQFILKKESIGFGDVKLGLILGGFLGMELSVLALYLSFVSSAFIVITTIARGKARRGAKIPFGPYLAIGTLATLLTNLPGGGNMIINWYFRTMF
jgi:leader peptidase (prepilin peptidase)/N-methyltransferase